MQDILNKDLFLQVKNLSEKKRKNEAAVPIELLTTKYKVPYEKLCLDLQMAQKNLRLNYSEILRKVNDFISESVYMDLSDEAEWSALLLSFKELYEREDVLTRELAKAFVLVINGYVKGESNE